MPQADYPTAADLTAFIESGGLTADAALVDAAIGAGIAAFEEEVGRKMLAGAAETRYFDPPQTRDGILTLDDDLATAPSAVSYQPQGASPQALVALTDYILLPDNAFARGKPVTRIRFLKRWWAPYGWGLLRSLSITARFGYGTEIPDDAWFAMLVGGVRWLVDMQVIAITGFVQSRKEADVDESYGGALKKDLMDSWNSLFMRAVADYTKV